MKHQSQNNFRPYFKEYPWKENIIDKALESEEVSDQTVINAAHEQIEALMTLKPFDPEDFGFKANKILNEFLEEWVIITDNVRCFLKRDQTLNKNYWKIVFKVKATHIGEEVFDEEAWIKMEPNVAHVFIPHDLAGRMILTGLSVIARRDLDDEGKGCPDDDDFDGTCPFCENMGRCINNEKSIYQSKAEEGDEDIK